MVANPVSRARSLAADPGLSLAVGAALIAITIALAQCFIVRNGGTWNLFGSTDITKTSDASPRSTGRCPSPACPDILAQVELGAKTDTNPPDLSRASPMP